MYIYIQQTNQQQSAQGSTNTIEIDMNVEAALSGENSEGSEDERTKEMMARRAKGGASQVLFYRHCHHIKQLIVEILFTVFHSLNVGVKYCCCNR